MRSPHHPRRTARRSLALAWVALAGLGGTALAAGTPASPDKPAPTPHSDGSVAAGAKLDRLIASVPQSTLDSVGLGSDDTQDYSIAQLTGPALTAAGKPELLVGTYAWCPHCAAGNVAVSVALSHFGTLSGLRSINTGSYFSSLPDINGVSFDRASYASSSVSFSDAIAEDRAGNTYEQPTAAQAKAFAKINGSTGGFPVYDIGGRYGVEGIPFDPAIVKGMSTMQIASSLANPHSKVARAIDGFANLLTAGICASTGQQPAAVCSSAGVTAAAKGL